ncbi:alpha-ketoacid dehydrogenase subunit beta [Candidatus Micrarchaeota archaeon]|nr:alpha-ketoacid dehydrogenase subunit beta [Candidatus Micrarchaeota archaeon]
MATLSMIQAINQAMLQEMERDPSVVLLGEDVGHEGGVFRATDGLQAKFGKERVIDTPLAEENIIATSVGMAAAGLRPIAEIQFSGFLHLAFDHLVNHAARMYWRTRGRWQMPIVVRTPAQGGIRALEHHSESMETFFTHTPGLKCVMPSNPYDAKGLLVASIRDGNPVIFLEPTRLYRSAKGEVPEGLYEVPLGVAKVVQEGRHVTVVSYGGPMKACIDASAKAREKGIECEVIDLRSLSPLDETNEVAKSVMKTGRLVVVHEAPRTLGIASEIMARVNEKAFTSLQAPMKRVTGFDVQFPLARFEDYFVPDSFRVLSAIEETAGY